MCCCTSAADTAAVQLHCAAITAADLELHNDHCCCEAAQQAVVVMAASFSCYQHGVVATLKFEDYTCGDEDVEDAQ